MRIVNAEENTPPAFNFNDSKRSSNDPGKSENRPEYDEKPIAYFRAVKWNIPY